MYYKGDLIDQEEGYGEFNKAILDGESDETCVQNPSFVDKILDFSSKSMSKSNRVYQGEDEDVSDHSMIQSEMYAFHNGGRATCNFKRKGEVMGDENSDPNHMDYNFTTR